MRRFCTALSLLALCSCGLTPPLETPAPTPPVRYVPSSAAGGLSLIDASFATQIDDRQPARISTSVSLPAGEENLLFWMEFACTRLCGQQLAEAGEVTVFLEWYKEEGGHLLKQASMPLNVKGTLWRTWGSKRVTAGTWVSVVRAEDFSWVCLREQCFFSIAVQP